MPDLPLPRNVDAERAVLAAILFDNSTLAVASELGVSSADFSVPENATVFSSMVALAQASQPIDQITLCESLRTTGNLERAGGDAYILSLSRDVVSVNVDTLRSHAEIVRNKAQLRVFIQAGAKLLRNAYEPEANLAELQAGIRQLVTGAAGGMPKVIGGNGHLSYSLDEFLATQFPTPDHLVEGMIPRNGTAMIVAMPHHLKSWFTTALALACTRAGEKILGKLTVTKPVRTMLVQVEEFPGQLQGRIRQLLGKPGFEDCNRELVRIIPRHSPPVQLPDENAFQVLLREIEQFKAEHVVLDVLRRIIRGDLNSPVDSAAFLESVDRLRESVDCTVTLVHHENRKEADILYASAGSYNFPGWANSIIQFKRKCQQPDGSAHVEIEVDNKLAQSPDPMRLILDLGLDNPVRLEALEDVDSVQELRDKLGSEWSLKDMGEALGVSRNNADRRLKRLISRGIVEKLYGRRGRGGLARYQFVGDNVH